MSYVADFTKNNENGHNYEEFFGRYVNGDEMLEAQKEISRLKKLLEETSNAYTFLLNQRYNATFSPISKDIILIYETRNGVRFCFDALNGSLIEDTTDNCTVILLYTKTGEFSTVVGYCYELGSVVVRKYRYSISTNNSKINLHLVSETLVSLFEGEIYEVLLNGLMFDTPRKITGYSSHSVTEALKRINSTEFIQTFYGLDEEASFNFSLELMRNRVITNKSFEIIIKTCKDSELIMALFDFKTDKAVPLHKLVDTTKADWEYAESLGVLKEFIGFKKEIAYNSYYSSSNFKMTIPKTDREWIDFIEKVRHWEGDLDFYSINYGNNLLNILIKAYIGGGHPFYYTKLPKYYKFNKFASYVIEGSINQGFTKIEDFIKFLTDYIRMCVDLDIIPTLKSPYLRQTHDVIARNHKIKLTKEQESIFGKRYEDFKGWVDNNVDNGYTVIGPIDSTDLVKEGDTLNHCVGSYIKRVLDDECLILFLRDALNPTKPLVTLEIRNNSIVHASGAHNRPVTEQEREALCRFAKKMGWTVRV